MREHKERNIFDEIEENKLDLKNDPKQKRQEYYIAVSTGLFNNGYARQIGRRMNKFLFLAMRTTKAVEDSSGQVWYLVYGGKYTSIVKEMADYYKKETAGKSLTAQAVWKDLKEIERKGFIQIKSKKGVGTAIAIRKLPNAYERRKFDQKRQILGKKQGSEKTTSGCLPINNQGSPVSNFLSPVSNFLSPVSNFLSPINNQGLITPKGHNQEISNKIKGNSEKEPQTPVPRCNDVSNDISKDGVRGVWEGKTYTEMAELIISKAKSPTPTPTPTPTPAFTLTTTTATKSIVTTTTKDLRVKTLDKRIKGRKGALDQRLTERAKALLYKRVSATQPLEEITVEVQDGQERKEIEEEAERLKWQGHKKSQSDQEPLKQIEGVKELMGKLKFTEKEIYNTTANPSLKETAISEEPSITGSGKDYAQGESSTHSVVYRYSSFQEANNPEFKGYLQSIYPGVNVEVEFSKMDSWVRVNPEKKKKNYARFCRNWVNMADKERWEGKPTAVIPSEPELGESRFDDGLPEKRSELTEAELEEIHKDAERLKRETREKQRIQELPSEKQKLKQRSRLSCLRGLS